MIISINTLATAINEKRYVKPEELAKDNSIIRIAVNVTNNHRKIEYSVDTRQGKREFYTESTVPHSIITIINRETPIYHEIKQNNDELFVYSFVS